jgi:hypothetical protein
MEDKLTSLAGIQAGLPPVCSASHRPHSDTGNQLISTIKIEAQGHPASQINIFSARDQGIKTANAMETILAY